MGDTDSDDLKNFIHDFQTDDFSRFFLCDDDNDDDSDDFFYTFLQQDCQ
jgi:hypothetical protein